jgi:hypothetical protein
VVQDLSEVEDSPMQEGSSRRLTLNRRIIRHSSQLKSGTPRHEEKAIGFASSHMPFVYIHSCLLKTKTLFQAPDGRLVEA